MQPEVNDLRVYCGAWFSVPAPPLPLGGTPPFRCGIIVAERPSVSPRKRNRRVDKSQSAGFRGVPEDVWNFHIGGY